MPNARTFAEVNASDGRTLSDTVINHLWTIPFAALVAYLAWVFLDVFWEPVKVHLLG